MLFRKIMKLAGLIAVGLLILAVGVVVNMAGFFLPRHLSHARAGMQRCWARLSCYVLGIRILFREPIGKGDAGRGCFVVSNHVSYLDILVLAAALPAVFLSKHEVRDWPLLGWLATLAGTVYVDRTAKRSALAAMERIEERLAHGVHVVVFPEGTTSDGCRVLPFKSTFFDLPSRLMVPVLPVAIRYLSVDGMLMPANEPSPLAWHGDEPLGSSLWRILGMGRIEVRVSCASLLHAASGSDRKELSRTAQAEVGAVYWTLLEL